MKCSPFSWRVVHAAACLLTLSMAPARACTDVLVKTGGGQVVSGRNMDYPHVFHSKVVITPAGQAFRSTAPSGLPALEWVARYGYVGVTGGTPFIADGMNEEGLSIAKQTLAATRFPDPVPDRPNLEMKLFCDWILGRFATVDEVAKALPAINPVETQTRNPVHFAFHDRTGHSAVLEFIHGKLMFHPNANGVMTNGPSFDWHETHLRYYQWEQTVPDSAVAVPGGYFSAERFLRATVLRDALPAPATPQAAAADALRILESVAAPRGMPGTYREKARDGGGGLLDFTQWTVVRDHVNLVYYYRTFDSPGLKAVRLKDLDLSGRTRYPPIPVEDGDWFVAAPIVPQKAVPIIQ